jgi:LEA14-like dessication related protein
VLFGAGLIFGCSAKHIDAPDIALVDLRFERMEMLETSLLAKIRIDNENVDSINMQGGVFRVYINDIYIGKGLSDQEFEIPRLGSVTQHVTIRVDNLRVLAHVQNLLENGDFRYRIEGKLFAQGALGKHGFELLREGRVNLTRMPPPSPQFTP